MGKRPTTNNCLLLRSPMPVLNQPTRWLNVIHDMANTWLVVFCTEVMLYQKMLMQPLLLSRPSVLFNLWIGVQLVSRLESITNHLPLYQAEILQRFNVQFVCCQTLLQLQRLGPALIISLILCTPSVHLSIGMLEKAWKKVSFPKPAKIWLLLRRTTKRLE